MSARDLVVWQLLQDGPGSVNGAIAPSFSSQSFYDYFSVKEDDFTVSLLGKDGTEKLRRT